MSEGKNDKIVGIERSAEDVEEVSHNDIVKMITNELKGLKEAIDEERSNLMIPSDDSIKLDTDFGNSRFKLFLMKWTVIVSIACLIISIYTGPTNVFLVVLIWSGFTLPYWFIYLISNADSFFNKRFNKKIPEKILYELKPSYMVKSIGVFGICVIIFGIVSIIPDVIDRFKGDSFVQIVGVTAFLAGCALFLLLPMALILCLSGVKLYDHGIVSAWKPISLMFSSDPYFIPFSEVKTIGVPTLSSLNRYFVMRDGTIAYYEGQTGNLYSNDDKLLAILELHLKLKCPEADRFEFQEMKELKMFVTGKPNGKLKKYKPKKNRIKQIP